MEGPVSERITTREIIEALTTTLTNARIEGDPYKSPAEEHLAAIVAILLRLALERHDLEKALQDKRADLERLDHDCELFLNTRADEIWNELGCPDYDPIYNILFPSTATSGSNIPERIERLSVVADLLSSGVHPRINLTRAALAAEEIRALAEKCHEFLFVLSKLQTRKSALGAFEASVARIGLLELGTLRKKLRGMGLDDSDIKSVVPPPVSSRRISLKKE